MPIDHDSMSRIPVAEVPAKSALTEKTDVLEWPLAIFVLNPIKLISLNPPGSRWSRNTCLRLNVAQLKLCFIILLSQSVIPSFINHNCWSDIVSHLPCNDNATLKESAGIFFQLLCSAEETTVTWSRCVVIYFPSRTYKANALNAEYMWLYMCNTTCTSHVAEYLGCEDFFVKDIIYQGTKMWMQVLSLQNGKIK